MAKRSCVLGAYVYDRKVSGLAERWLRTVPAFREMPLRMALMAAEIAALPETDVAEALEHISLLAEQADERAREVLGAAMPLLTDPAQEKVVGLLRTEAQSRHLFALARLLRTRSKVRETAREPNEPANRHPNESRYSRPLTLGERKSLARNTNRDMLDRLLRDPHPQVIRNILANPRITEDDVVQLAAKRPTFPDIQAEIAKSPKWCVRQRVRMAIVQNPYTPSSIAVPILSLLIRPELEQVLAATDIPPLARAAALELLDRRPPIAPSVLWSAKQ